ncbi:MAG: histone deacetylase family protein [Granulosicoccus sp.]|nr:histone deacetylase family protein [Granulosicoccus sp.]
MSTALISHPDCVLHEISPGHPECPERIDAIKRQLESRGLYDSLQHHEAEVAQRERLTLGHAESYVDMIFKESPESGRVQLDPDTAMNPHSLSAALRGAGAGMQAVDLVCGGHVSNAFCMTRPPGHHAEYDKAMGFCFFGNIAIAARYAVKQHGMERVAILDFDVHHGNGTEDIVDGDESILFCSSFQHPFYPGGYRQNVPNQRINVPLDAGCGSHDFQQAIVQQWLPALEEFKPQMIFVSAGFDAHEEDPLASICLLDDDFVWISQQIMSVADRFADGRIVSMLEGGYALAALGRCATAHVEALMSA